MIDIIWLSSMGGALAILTIESIVFFSRKDPARKHYGGLVIAFTVFAFISLATALHAAPKCDQVGIEAWFQLPRLGGWAFIVLMCARLLLFQLGKLNGVKSN